jgi:hypothetical protein
MSLINLLKDSINKKCIIDYNPPFTFLKIHNSDNDDALKLVKIKTEGINNLNILQIEIEKVGKNELLTSVLSINWINQRTDALLYTLHENIHKFIIIEVKTNKPSGCTNQFKSMHSLIVYLIKALSFEYNIDFEKIKIAKVLITSRISKLEVKNKGIIPYNYRINANEISYKKEDNEPLTIMQILNCDFAPLI